MTSRKKTLKQVANELQCVRACVRVLFNTDLLHKTAGSIYDGSGVVPGRVEEFI